MTTTSLHSQGPSFHVRSHGSAFRTAVITGLWLIMVLGFVAQIAGGAARQHDPEARVAAARLEA